MTKLLLCPFCDEEPSFTDVELKDERRYAEKLLRCCSIEMSATLSFGQYKGLTDAQIDHQLRSELVKNWNTRAQPQGAPVTDAMINAGAAALFGDGWAKNATPANRRYCREKARDIFAAMSSLLLSRPAPQQAPVTAQEHLQSRGRHYDIIKEAIAAYDEYMLDDDYDAQRTLDSIIKKMRERVELSDAPSSSMPRPHRVSESAPDASIPSQQPRE